jgi:hypothetical protein
LPRFRLRGIFAAWVYRDELLGPAELESVSRRLCEGARAGLGTPTGEGTLRRSFSLLDLAAMLGRAKPDERLMVYGRELQETLADVSP